VDDELQALIDLGIFAQAVSPATIRDRYLQAAKRHHPDRGGDPDRMKAINNAYKYLRQQGGTLSALQVSAGTTIDFTVPL
jgi:hypothetical protein